MKSIKENFNKQNIKSLFFQSHKFSSGSKKFWINFKKINTKGCIMTLKENSKSFLLLFLIGFITLLLLNTFSEMAFAVNQYVKPGEDELQTVWERVSQFFGGVGGKLASLGMIVASILSKERIGIPMMLLGIIAGMMIPSLPTIIDNFTINF